jgi:hypothetical protein
VRVNAGNRCVKRACSNCTTRLLLSRVRRVYLICTGAKDAGPMTATPRRPRQKKKASPMTKLIANTALAIELATLSAVVLFFMTPFAMLAGSVA